MLADLEKAFGQFVEELKEYTASLHGFRWTRCEVECYDHKRCFEVSFWYSDANQEFGHVFLARGWEWDGTVDWDKVQFIINTHDWAIGPSEDIKVWNLAKLIEQAEPMARCVVCGQLK